MSDETGPDVFPTNAQKTWSAVIYCPETREVPFLLCHHVQVPTVLLRSGVGWCAGQTKQLKCELVMGRYFKSLP
jgi:hypothetical protein